MTRVMLAILIVLAGLNIIPAASATSSGEDFEDDTQFFPPTAPWYTLSSGNQGSNYVDANPNAADMAMGAKVYRQGATTSRARFNFNAGDLCSSTSTATFSFSYSAAVSATGAHQAALVRSTTAGNNGANLNVMNPAVGFTISSTGVMSLFANSDNTDSTPVTVPGLTVTNTWYDISISFGPGCTGQVGLTIKPTGGTAADVRGVSMQWASGTAATGINSFITGGGSGGNDDDSQLIDNLALSVPTQSSTLPNGNDLAVTTLTGFDVDASGSIAILRTRDAAGLDNVRTYDAGTLAQLGGPVNTHCSRSRGVTAMRSDSGEDYVAYFQCDAATASNVVAISIRNRALGDPDRPSVCPGIFLNFCDTDIFDSELAGDSDQHYDFYSTEAYPIDYSVYENGFADEDWVAMAFAVSTTAGEIGVVTYVMNRDGDDKSQITLQNIAGQGNPVDSICTVQDANGHSYLYGADNQAQVKGYKLTFTLNNPSNDLSLPTLAVDMDLVFPGTADTAAPRGVACGEGKLAVLGSDKITVWTRTEQGFSPAPYLTIGNCSPAGASCVPRTFAGTPPIDGIAMSGDGDWLVYTDDSTTARFVSLIGRPATDTTPEFAAGQEVAHAAMPTGSFVKLQLKGTGTTAWAATSTTVRVFPRLYQYTTGNDTACNPGQVGCGPVNPNLGGDIDSSSGGSMADGLLGGFGISKESQYIFGLALLAAYLLIARRKLDHDAETAKIVVLVLWVAFVWLGIWEAWSLVAAGFLGVAMFSKAGTKLLGG